MAGEKKSVASLTLLADQPKQALEELLQAETRVTEQGGKLATSFATGFEAIEDKAKKALATIANGGNAEAQLNKLVTEYGRLKTAQDAATASGQKLPEEFERAFSVAEKQITNVTAAMARQREQTAELKSQFQQLAAAEDGVATAATNVAAAEASAATETARLAQVEKDAAVAAEQLRAQQEELVAQTKYLEEEAITGAQSVDKMMAALREPGAQQPLEKERAALVEVRSALERDITTYKEFGDAGSKAADITRAKIADVDRAIEKLGSEQQAFGQLTNNFRTVERVFDEFEQKVAGGGAITARAITPVIQNFERLKEQMQQTSDVTPEMNARFAQLETRLKSVDAETRKSIDAMADHKTLLAEGGVAWTGFGNSVGVAAGKYGAVVSAAGAVAAALTAGIQVGNQFNQAIGADMEAFNEFTDDAKGRAKQFVETWAQGFFDTSVNSRTMVASLRLTADAFSALRDIEERTGKELDDYKAKEHELQAVGEVSRKALGAGVEIQKLWNEAKKAAGDDVDALAKKTQSFNQIIDLHSKLVAHGVEGEKAWKDLHVAHGDTIEKLQARLKALGIDVDHLADSFTKAKAAEDAAKAGHEAWAKSFGNAEQKQRDLTDTLHKNTIALGDADVARSNAEGSVRRYSASEADLAVKLAASEQQTGATSAATEQLRAEHDRVAQALEAARTALSAATAEQEHASQAISDNRKALADNSVEVVKSSSEIYSLVDALNKEAGTRRQLSGEQTQQAERLKQLALTSHDLYGADGQLDEQLQKMILRYHELSTATSEQTDAAGNNVKVALTEQRSVRDELEGLGKAIEARVLHTKATESGSAAASSSAAAVGSLADATSRANEAIDQGAKLNIHWSETGNGAKLSADDAAGVMERLATAHTQAADAADRNATATTAATAAVTKTTDAVDKATSAGEEATPAFDKTADAVERIGGAGSKAAASLASLTTNIDIEKLKQMDEFLSKIADHVDSIATRAPDAAAALAAMSEAGMSDA